MTQLLETGGSRTLQVLFGNVASEEQNKAIARANMRGPYYVGELTAYVFRSLNDNGRPMELASLDDCGLASGEGGRQEVDLNQMGPEELPECARSWYETQLSRTAFGPNQKVAVVFDGSRSGAPELSDQDALVRRLDEMSRPSMGERALAAVKRTLATMHL